MSLPSSMADFVPCDRLLQKAYWKEEAWKNQSFNGIRTSDVRDAGAMLYQLSYEATHWERCHGFESRWSPDFSRLLLSNCLNCEINCDDHSSLSSISAIQIWITSYMLHVIWLARWKNAKEGQAMKNQASSWPFPFSGRTALLRWESSHYTEELSKVNLS